MTRSYIKLISSMLIWGTLAIFVKAVSFSSELIVLFRIIFGLLFLLFVFFSKKKKFNRVLLKKYGVRLLVTGVFMGGNWVALFEAYRFVDVSIATLCYYFAPVIVCVCSAFLFNEKLTFVKILSVLSAGAGMFIVTGVSLTGESPVKGVIYGIASAAMYACVTLSNKSVKGLSGLEITIVQLVGAGIVMFPYVMLNGGFAAPKNGAVDIVCVLILGFVHTGIALYMYFSAIQELPAQTVALCSYADPVSALIFAAVFLNDIPNLSKIFGALLIIGGAATPQIVQAIGDRKKAKCRF